MVEPARPVASTGALAARVGVVVAVHATDRARLERCLDALRRSDPDIEVVVVDNSGRTDPVVQQGVSWKAVENRGFGAAINAGVADDSIVSTEFVVALNDDVEVTVGWLEPLVAALDADAGLGAAQPKLLLADATPPVVNSLGVALDRFGAGADIGFGDPDADTPHAPDTPDHVVRSIEAFTGGAVVFRREFFDRLGGFDERLFLYYEDVDLALRGAERGWRYACVTTSTVTHAKGSTTATMRDEARRLQERNRLIVAARFLDPATVGRSVWLSVRRLRHRPRTVHARALAGGLVRMPRAVVERLAARRQSMGSAAPPADAARGSA